MTIDEFAKALPSAGALLGLDQSANTVGLSISDEGRSLALPLRAMSRTRLAADLAQLKKIIMERKITGLVLGLPLNMDGSEGPRAQSVRTFASNLRKEISLPLVFWDERLSTFEAGLALSGAGLSRKKPVDAHAAAIILQGALDKLKTLA